MNRKVSRSVMSVLRANKDIIKIISYLEYIITHNLVKVKIFIITKWLQYY